MYKKSQILWVGPCLAHVVNLMVKKLISIIDKESDTDFDGNKENDEPQTGYFIEKVRNAVNSLHENKRHDWLLAIQLGSNLSVNKGNCTRWNSLSSMMKRFIELKNYIPMALTEDEFPAAFNWDKLQHLCNILELLKIVTMDLQNMHADAELAIWVIRCLRRFSSSITAMKSAIFSVLSKWVDSNSIVDAIYINRVVFIFW